MVTDGMQTAENSLKIKEMLEIEEDRCTRKRFFFPLKGSSDF